MVLALGNYNSRPNSAAKTSGTGWVRLFDGGPGYGLHWPEVETYDEFDPMNATFILDGNFDVNFGYFIYNGKKYCGYITKSAVCGNTFAYTFSIDGLSTCWENGCMNVEEFVEYGDIGNSESTGTDWQNMYDPRLPMNAITFNAEYNIDQSSSAQYVVLIMADPIIGNSINPLENRQPGYLTYAMPIAAYWAFCKNLMFDMSGPLFGDPTILGYSNLARNIVSSSIIKAYSVPENVYNDFIETGVQTNAIAVRFLYRPTLFGLQTGDWEIQEFSVSTQSGGFGGTAYAVYPTSGSSPAHTADVSTTGNGSARIGTINGSITIHCLISGDIVFTPKEYGISSITTCGYRNRYDVVGGVIESHAVINGGDYYELSTSGPIPTMINPFQVESKSMTIGESSMNAAVSSAVSGVASFASGNYIGAAMSAMNALGNTITPPAYKTGNNGITGGNIELWGTKGSYIKIRGKQQPKVDDFQSIYGKPIFCFKNLANDFHWNDCVTHYAKTKNCHLKTMGLPNTLVREAEQVIDNGAFLGLLPY